MTGRNFDTDPSTPGALRGAAADTDPAGGPAEAKKASTDPGVGPPGPALPRTAGALRPPPVPPGSLNSVEMLLDGMNSPQPERQKLTPQSAGEAAAAYHAEHPVHPARTSPDEEPKVIVERPPLVPTVKVQREQVQAIIEQADAMRRAAEDEEAAAQATVPVSMGPRVLIAAVAGLVVVLLIFLVARGKSGGTQGATTMTTATATATATSNPTPTPTPTNAASSVPIPVAETTEEPTAAPPPTAHVPISALPAAPPTAPATTGKPRPRPTSSSDLGEFKTTFH